MNDADGTPLIPFEAVEHTADLAFIARGRTPEELYANAAAGMISFLYDSSGVAPVEEEQIDVEGFDREELLVAFLQEILFRLEIRGRLYADIRVESAEPPRLFAVARGEPRDPARHEMFADVKAATYHGLAVRSESAGAETIWTARVVLDV